ncbi:catalase [Helicobacter cappadocius]|uniref:catalase n=1 Tax=Helicobacter cappadocius TaxID=3063998 RepID=A0AA90PJX8_9HELI|nr:MULTISPECIES: catalase [unclassified Helicobacter]MDO7253410.1 catalase [Helicobacter sp. faydin-H75]MDP2539326.1 catalase [Helicobacter sp. faydin-H76]
MKYIFLIQALLVSIVFATESITPTQTADFFYHKFGDKADPHRKVNHTKGFCVSGEFLPRKDIREFVKVPLLYTKSEVLARYSIGGGNPKASDKSSAHGFALKLKNGKQEWDFATLNSVINSGKTPDVIVKFLEVIGDPTKKKELQELIKKYPSVKRAMDYGDTIGVPVSLANVQFNTQHVYRVSDSDGKLMNAKIIFVPQAGIIELSEKEAKKVGDDFLEKRLEADLKKGSVNYYMYLVLANPKDPVDDISAAWENTNKKIFLGTLELKTFKGNSCNTDLFLPGMLPNGVQAPVDSVFEFRNQTYSITHQRRE